MIQQQRSKGTAMIRLEPIGPENWRESLSVAEEQKHYMSSPERILARAYAYREERSRALMILNGGTPVGMALYYDCEELKAYDFSQLFIDERYQGNGYGEQAARLILDEMRRGGRYKKAVLCYIEGNDAARGLYEKLGFRETGERDGDEIIMEKEL